LKDLILKTQKKAKKESMMQLKDKHDVSDSISLIFFIQKKEISDQTFVNEMLGLDQVLTHKAFE
jgi:hypothetical protein